MTVIGQDDLVAPICPPLRLERSGLESVRFRLLTIALFEVAAALRFWALESLRRRPPEMGYSAIFLLLRPPQSSVSRMAEAVKLKRPKKVLAPKSKAAPPSIYKQQ